MTSLRQFGARPILLGLVPVAAGIGVAVSDPFLVEFMIVLNIFAIAFALLLRHSSSAIDGFEPIVVFSAAWAVMFVLRPIGMLVYGDMTLRYTYDAIIGLPWALGLSALGAVSFGVGYTLPYSRAIAGRLGQRAESWSLPADGGKSVALICIALSAVGAVVSGGTVASAWVTYLPLLAVPGSLLLLGRDRSRPSIATLLAFGALAALLVQAVAVGQRSIVFYVFGSLAVLFYARRNRRPSVKVVALGGAIALLVFVNGLEVLRSRAEALGSFDVSLVSPSDFAPEAAIERLLIGPSTEMLPALAVQIETEGKLWGFTPGYLALAVATHWVPGGVWADKFLSSDELLYSRLFPSHYALVKANAQFSILGGFYFDAGVVGVLFGTFVLGVLSRFIGGLLSVASASSAARLLYAPFIPLFVVLLRGDTALTLGLALYMYAPLLLAIAFSRVDRRAVPSVSHAPSQ